MSDFSPPDVTEMRHHAWQRPAGGGATAGEDAFGFWDLVDIVNPLQHIPVVSTIYRQITGDEIRPEARILGSTLYGGPVGLIAGVAGAVVEEATGRTVEEHAVALLDGEPAVEPVQYAGLPPETGAAPKPEPAPVPVPEPRVAADAPAGTEAEPSAAASVTETVPSIAPETAPQAAAEPEPRRTADLPHGFALAPRTYATPRALPPSDPVTATRTIRAAPGETTEIDGGLDAALALLAARSAPPDAPEVSEGEGDDDGGTRPAEAGTTDAATRAYAVPEAAVPAAMMRALDLYGQFRTAPPASAGLDMRS